MSENTFQAKRVKQKVARRKRAHRRLRNRVEGTGERPRLAVFKSLKHIYAQVIDDQQGHTLVQASTLDPEIKGKLEGASSNKAAARLVGEAVASRAKEKGLSRVVFDRGGYIYHGKIQEVAEGARSKGLEF